MLRQRERAGTAAPGTGDSMSNQALDGMAGHPEFALGIRARLLILAVIAIVVESNAKVARMDRGLYELDVDRRAGFVRVHVRAARAALDSAR